MHTILFFLLGLTLVPAEPRPMEAVDIFSLPIARKASLSPDGESLLFQKSEINWKRNRWVTQLWLKNLTTGELRQLTHNRNGAWDAQWSPDASRILFLSERDNDDTPQLYLLPTDGGEARRISDLAKTPYRIEWAPDGKSIYFQTNHSPAEDEKNRITKKQVIPQFENPAHHKTLHQLELETSQTEQINAPGESIFGYSLSKDGRRLILLKGKGARLDNIYHADLWIRGNETKDLRVSQNQIAEWSTRFSPDSTLLAYLASVNEADEGYHKTNLFLLDPATRERTLLTKSFPGEVRGYAWDQDGKGLFFLGNIGVSSHLFHLNRQTSQITQLTSGNWTITEWNYHRESGSHLFKRVSATEPGDFWSLENEKPKRLTHLHKNISEKFILPRQELVHWKSHDGTTIEGLLTYPLDYQEGTPFPLVTDTHGGPQKSDQYGIWSSGRYLPVLAAQGYGIFLPNHRGSTGYGDPFMRDMVGNYFRNSHLDVLSGIDHLVAEGLADPGRLVKKGWSAGGHMTNKLITYTNRFKAASSGAGVVDWASQFGETDTFYRRTWWFDGKPWQENAPTETFTSTSIMKDLWKVKTPTLIFVGENDVRVPASQSKMLYRALRDLNVETELYIAPGEPHGYKKPSHRLFRINKEMEWFEKHVHGREYKFSEPAETRED